MANAATADAGGGEESGGKKGKGKLMMIVGLVVALAAGGGGAYFYFGKSHSAGGETKAAETHKKPMTYVPMDTFTVNLLDPEQERYLQINLSLGMKDAAAGEGIKTAMPALRNAIVMLLSNKTADELMTRDGKTKLAEEILAELNKTMDAHGKPGPEQVLFSSFVIQ